MLRNLTAALLIFAALVLQASLVNRLLGAYAPDFVLLIILTLAALRGPQAGAVIGFSGGLAYDLLPPASHTLGQYALLLCALGYAAGRVGGQSPMLTVAVCAVVAPGLAAGIGALLGHPGVTWTVLRSAWPRAALCDLVAVPAVVWLLSDRYRLRRRRGRAGSTGMGSTTSWGRGTA
ncbi:rod shape-determining protein MreD [Sphaerimonospora cavernae]|uniref:Rod shape-determining protein MreD n=1 Tax=Sphaerimonospora cavernae TaxID=1740611 RepID=A0ABV6TY60_9ACTN